MKVSVLVKTFQHEACIGQALQGALAQTARFAWEVVVGEDASRDGTREVVRAIAARSDGRVRPIFRERNLGPVANFLDTLAACRGEYIALLDGDDWWTVPHKLERQAAFLDAHPEATACTHDALVVDSTGRGDGRCYCSPNLPRALTLERVLKGNPVPACSLMFRRDALTPLPGWFPEVPFTDWPLVVLLAHSGPIGYDREPMAAYRVHSGGMWSAMAPRARLEATFGLYERFRAEFGPKHDARIRRRMARVALKLALACAESGQRDESRAALRRAFRLAGAGLPLLLVRRDFRRLVPRLL